MDLTDTTRHLDLLAELVAIPGPPGQEERVRACLEAKLDGLGIAHETDVKGNLMAWTGSSRQPRVVVTAHMDEVAMIVKGIEPDGRLAVTSLGGLFPWKLGEGPVAVLAESGDLNGVLSMGSIHTEDPDSNVRTADEGPVTWEMVWVETGLASEELTAAGVRPGTRVAVHPTRRTVTPLGKLVAGPFMDDRADLVSWLLAVEAAKVQGLDALFAATVCEEVGGHGALWLLDQFRPEVCVALELGPNVADAPVRLDGHPTVWASDGYATMAATDLSLVCEVGRRLGLEVQPQVLSRGGSDASCGASRGVCARPFTLGIPMENSHGHEVIDPASMGHLARLAVGLLKAVSKA